MSLPARLRLAVGLVAIAILATLWRSDAADRVTTDPLLALCADALLIELWLVVLAFVCVLLPGRSPRRALGLAPGRLGGRRVAVLALGTLAASHALDGALDLSGLADHSVLAELPRVLEGARGMPLALAVLALGIAPGIAEELLCRGLVQRGLARRFGPAVAIPAAALLFGALHVEPVHGLFAMILGLYLGWIAYRARSTRPAMFCHAANNVAAVLLGARVGDAPWASEASVAGGIAVAIACLWAAARPPPGHAVRETEILEEPPPLQPRSRSSDR